MLNDTERKILRILNNFLILNKRVPTLQELEVKSGRAPARIIVAIRGLSGKTFIDWNGSDLITIRIIKAWE